MPPSGVAQTMRYALGLALLLLFACSPVPRASPSAQPAKPHSTAVPARPRPPVLVVVRTDAGNAGTALVSLVEETGRTIASVRFAPPGPPVIGNAAALRQYPVQVAAGAVFFADAKGVVRRLGRDGKVTIVTTFPVHSAQDELSFAVSPDGARLLASILSTPPVHVPPPKSVGDPVFADQGHWSLQLFTTTPGAAPTSTFHEDLGTAFPKPTIVVGWDENGPLATVNAVLATQNALPSVRFAGDALIHIAPDGSHLDRLGGPDCRPLDELLDGTVLCQVGGLGSSTYEVRRATGVPVWRADLHGSFIYNAHLSPDGQRVASGDLLFGAATRPASAARQATPAAQREAEGWLDSSTVVQADGSPSYLIISGGFPLSLVNAADPGQQHDLGVSGDFVGAI